MGGRIATAAAEAGVRQGHIGPADPAQMARKIRASMWNPVDRDPLTDGKADR